MRVASALGFAAIVTATVYVVFDWELFPAAGWIGVIVVVMAIAYRWGRWWAVLWLGVVPWAVPSIVADALWLGGIWERSSEYEPLPFSMFILPLLVPTLAVAAAVGVALRRGARQPSA